VETSNHELEDQLWPIKYHVL